MGTAAKGTFDDDQWGEQNTAALLTFCFLFCFFVCFVLFSFLFCLTAEGQPADLYLHTYCQQSTNFCVL